MKSVSQVSETRLKNATKWKRLYKEGDVALYSYWDGVDWKEHFAVKIKGEIKLVIDEDKRELDPVKIFQTACILINGSFNEKRFWLKNF